MPEYRLAAAARQDLREITAYIAQDNPDAAQRFAEAVFGALRRLAAMPEMGKQANFSNPKMESQRYWVLKEFPNYLIFYAPTESGIVASRIVHGARDLQSLLGGGRQ